MSWNLILFLWLLRINGLFFMLNTRSEMFAHFSKSSSSWQNKGERVPLKIQKKIQNALLRSSRSEIFFRTRSILRSSISGERQWNATWNAPRTRSVLIFLLGYFCPVLYFWISSDKNSFCLTRLWLLVRSKLVFVLTNYLFIDNNYLQASSLCKVYDLHTCNTLLEPDNIEIL